MDTKRYFVSQDLETIVTRWCDGQSWKAPEAVFFGKLRARLIEALKHAFREPVEYDATRYRIEISPLKLDSLCAIRRDPNDKSEFWIALDDIAVSSCDVHLEITRIYDCDARKIGVGSRDRARTLLQQVAECQRKYSDYARKIAKPKIVLADDGAYEGASIIAVARMLQRQGLPISTVKLGFATSKAVEAIINTLRPPEFSIATDLSVANIVGNDVVHVWVCERDFYLGVPRSGRTYGLPHDPDGAAPHEYPISFPYVEPFAVSRGGGSIDIGKFSFGRSQIEASIDLWNEIQRLNKTILYVSDAPRFPGPGLETEYEANKDKELISYIKAFASFAYAGIC